MSGLFGPKAASVTPQVYTGIQVSTSMQATPIPLMYGMTRGSMNLLWYGNFKANGNSSNAGKGGGSSQPSSYSYSASWAAGLCEGPITGIGQIWHDRAIVTLSFENLTLYLGSSGQAAWTIPPSGQQVPYDHIAYVASPAYNFGDSAAMPNLSFEIKGLLYDTGPPGPVFGGTFSGNLEASSNVITNCSPPGALSVGSILSDSNGNLPSGTAISAIGTDTITMSHPSAGTAAGDVITYTLNGSSAGDADPSLVFVDYLTEPNHGAGYAGTIASLSGNNKYQGYLWSLGIGLSPTESTQRQANDFLTELMQITNSDVVDSAGTLRVVPYADATVSGNGYSYAPNLTPIYSFDDDDFLPNGKDDPVELIRVPLSQTYNQVQIEYLDRANYYNTAMAQASDLNDINANGLRLAPVYTFHQITNGSTALTLAQLLLQASLYRRNTYRFRVRADYSLLEPMDPIAITDEGLGLVAQLCWVTQITDSAENELEIEAMEVTGVSNTTPQYNWQSAQGYAQNYNSSPGSVQAPLLFDMPPLLASGGTVSQLQIGIATAPLSTSANWNGCQVFMSLDGGNTYVYVGIITSPARYGTLTANFASGADPDTADTLSIAFADTNLTLSAGTSTDADNMQTLICIDPSGTPEIVAYSAASMTSAGHYNLGTYIRRGLYQTAIAAHSSGASFVRLDGNVFCIDLDPGMLGQTAYFKFCSFNMAGQATEELSAVTAYTHVIGSSPLRGNVAVLASGPTNSWIGYGNAVIGKDGTIAKTGGAAGWDSSAVTTQGFSKVFIQWKPELTPTSNNTMCGLTSTPVPDFSNVYANINYAWFNGAGGWYIYESGTGVGSYGTVSSSDIVGITYDGSTITYYLNGVAKRTVSVSGLTLYGKCAIYVPGGYVNSAQFGNTAVLPVQDTGQLGSNAATTVASSLVAGPVGVGHTIANVGSLTVGPFPVATSVVLTMSGYWALSYGGSAGSFAPNLEVGIGSSATAFDISAATVILDTSNLPIVSGTPNNWSGLTAYEVIVSLAAGVTQQYFFNCASPGGAFVFGYELANSTIKAEVIKR